MSISSRPDHFFQTEFACPSSLEAIDRKAVKSCNRSGDPINLSSKLLAIIPDPAHHGAVYIAESGGTIKRVEIETRRITRTYRGPSAPLTSLCLSADGSRLYAGCWDKLIWSWDVATCTPGARFHGHTDFVKSIICSRLSTGQQILISGGAEGDVLVWDPETGQRRGVLKGGSHAIQHLVRDPFGVELTLFAGFSDPGVRQFTITDLEGIRSLAFSPPPIGGHETSVYKLCFDADGDLWTASADKTTKHLVRADDWKADTTLTHPDFVRDVVVEERYGWVITACRDEEVRVWDLATGELRHTYSGHFDEVTGLCLVGDKVVSISIDATMRQWSLHPRDVEKARGESVIAAPEKAVEEVKQQQEQEQEHKRSSHHLTLTEEEERELDELMANEERELQELIANGEQ